MPKTLLDDHQMLNHELLPPEALLDDQHPANDAYLRSLEHHQRMIVSLSKQMKPKHVIMIKRRHTGEQVALIAQALNTTPTTVSKVCNSELGLRLRTMLQFYQLGIEGPNAAQKKNMLWRIARDSEQDQPKTAIQALAELNRMDTTDFERQNPINDPANQQPQVVIINQALLPKTELDA